MALQLGPTRRTEVHRLRLPTLILAPLVALVLQAYLPVRTSVASMLDLPLLMIVYIASVGRSQVAGLLTGTAIGIVRDSLSRDALGIFGIAGTVIAYVTSVASGRMETEGPGVRFAMIFVLYSLHVICVYLLHSVFVEVAVEPPFGRSLVAALVNALLGVLVFEVLDRLRKPA